MQARGTVAIMYPARVAGDSGLRLVCSQKNATLCAVARYAGFDSFVDEPRVYTRGVMLVTRYAGSNGLFVEKKRKRV